MPIRAKDGRQPTRGNRPLGRAVFGSPANSCARGLLDELLFIMNRPDNGGCASSEDQCPVCVEYHRRALKIQELWYEKASKLNIPLSGKGQCGAAPDVHRLLYRHSRAVFFMLEDKLASMQTRVSASLSRPRPHLASSLASLGKALHCSYAIPYVAIKALYL